MKNTNISRSSIKNGEVITFKDLYPLEYNGEIYNVQLSISYHSNVRITIKIDCANGKDTETVGVYYDVKVIAHLDETNLPQSVYDVFEYRNYNITMGVSPADLYNVCLYGSLNHSEAQTLEEIDDIVGNFNPYIYVGNLKERLEEDMGWTKRNWHETLSGSKSISKTIGQLREEYQLKQK